MAPLRSAKQPAAKAKKTPSAVQNVQGHDKEELFLLCDEELNLSSPARNVCENAVGRLGKLKDDGDNASSRRPSLSSSNGDVVEYSLSTEFSEEMGKLIFGDASTPQGKPERQLENFHKSLQFAQQPLFPSSDATSLPLKVASKFLLRMRPVTPENPERHLFSKVGENVRPTFSSPSKAETVAYKTVTPSLTTLAPKIRVSKKRPSLTTSTEETPASKKKRKTKASSTKANVKGWTIPQRPLAMTTPVKKTTSVTAPSLLPIRTIIAHPALQSPIVRRTATVSTVASTLSAASARTASSRSSILSILNAVQSEQLAARAPSTPTRHSWSNPQDLFQAQQYDRHPSGDVRLFDDHLSEDGDFQDDADFGLANPRDILEPDTSIYVCDRRPNVDIPTEIATANGGQHLDNRMPWPPVQPPIPPLQPSSPWSSIGYSYGRTSSSEASVPVDEYGQPPAAMMPMPASQSAFYGTRTRASLIDDEHADGMVNSGSEFLGYPLPSTSSLSLGPHFHPLPFMDRFSSSSKVTGSRQSNRDPSFIDDDFGGLLQSIASVSSPNGPLPPSPNCQYPSSHGPLPLFPFY